jgi:hypothetical protein
VRAARLGRLGAVVELAQLLERCTWQFLHLVAEARMSRVDLGLVNQDCYLCTKTDMKCRVTFTSRIGGSQVGDQALVVCG